MLNWLCKLSNALVDKRSHLSNFLIAARIQKLLIKNQIKILHYSPGRIRLKSPLWTNKTNLMTRLVEELEKEPRILAVTFTKEVGSILIIFDKSPVEDYSQIEHWLKKAEYITHNLIREGRAT